MNPEQRRQEILWEIHTITRMERSKLCLPRQRHLFFPSATPARFVPAVSFAINVGGSKTSLGDPATWTICAGPVDGTPTLRLALKQASCEADRPRDGFLISFDLVRI